ncbi:hypothetical protein GCM10023221_30390 [Luteimicrobium xylanilyticum]|uniref:Lipoprotein n=1 Tax=Luteimicrobium xylanilyticum TaxID=1133546 RepID=A0A5P9Q933_9MICO|nr:hypothetical protein [Luteimicrobium xylanilyticum]QFU97941.1 hypothetical protein KDY119_01447 [Luteimicrobium xylanilyticum]
MTSTRPAASALAAILAIALAGALGACSHDAPAPVSGLDLTADVDLVRGTVVEPMDRFRDSPEDDAVTQDAQQVATTLCAGKHGVTWDPYFADSTYDLRVGPVEGPWVEANAKKFGFLKPSSPTDVQRQTHPGTPEAQRLPGEKGSPNATLDDAQQKVVQACAAGPDATRFDLSRLTPQGPWDLARQTAHEKILSTEDDHSATSDLTRPVEDDYDACLRAAGAEPGAERLGWAKGADAHVLDAQQIALALTVVRCKTQVHYAQRLADIEAQLEAPIVEKYAHELTARKAKIDAVVADAKKYLARNPDVRPTG